MAHSWVPLSADIDLLSFDIQRGRDTGVMTYVQARELCGLSKVSSFDDLRCLLKDDDVLFKQFFLLKTYFLLLIKPKY